MKRKFFLDKQLLSLRVHFFYTPIIDYITTSITILHSPKFGNFLPSNYENQKENRNIQMKEGPIFGERGRDERRKE